MVKSKRKRGRRTKFETLYLTLITMGSLYIRRLYAANFDKI